MLLSWFYPLPATTIWPLTEFWYDHYVPKYGIKNWFFSTSPPISYEQIKNKSLSYSNVALHCAPHLAVGPKSVMDDLEKDDLMVGAPVPIFTNKGNVLLVKKGNPKNIRSIWDLGWAGYRSGDFQPLHGAWKFRELCQQYLQYCVQREKRGRG